MPVHSCFFCRTDAATRNGANDGSRPSTSVAVSEVKLSAYTTCLRCLCETSFRTAPTAPHSLKPYLRKLRTRNKSWSEWWESSADLSAVSVVKRSATSFRTVPSWAEWSPSSHRRKRKECRFCTLVCFGKKADGRNGANDGSRTHNRSLGSYCFAAKLHSHVVLTLHYFFLRSGTFSTTKWSKSTDSTKSRGLNRVLLNST